MQLTIAHAAPIGRGGRRIALTFRDIEKRLVLNQASRQTVEALAGTRDLFAWRGIRVRLITVDTSEGRRISVQRQGTHTDGTGHVCRACRNPQISPETAKCPRFAESREGTPRRSDEPLGAVDA